MTKKYVVRLSNPQSDLPHQLEVADAAALSEVIRQAVLTGLRQLPARPRPALVRVTQEEGYRGYTLYRLATTTEEALPLCVIGPLVQYAESGSLKKRPDTVDVRYGAHAEAFFADFFQRSAAHRKCALYEEFRLPKEERAVLEK